MISRASKSSLWLPLDFLGYGHWGNSCGEWTTFAPHFVIFDHKLCFGAFYTLLNFIMLWQLEVVLCTRPNYVWA